jgi:MFS family permease
LANAHSWQTIVATAIPTITTQFHSLPDIAWYGSSYFLTISAFQSQWGKIYKYFALKTAFLVAILIFELGSLICAVVRNVLYIPSLYPLSHPIACTTN